MLEIKELNVITTDIGKEILKDFSLSIQEGEIHAIMGPNGTGKSTLSKVIFHHPAYQITKGKMTFEGVDITDKETDEIGRMGLFLCMQDPLVIEGVTTSDFLREALYEKTKERVDLYHFVKEIGTGVKKLSLDENVIHQALNQGLSGGEKKKSEILQMLLLKPKFIILDELDSGLDVDSLKEVCKIINEYLKENPKTAVLMITHYSRILEYIHPLFVHNMVDGKIVETGDFHLAHKIEMEGYQVVEKTLGEADE